ncbi:MAG: class I SAM-dependent methyltransferase, partial [Nitrospiraceae bacterium]
ASPAARGKGGVVPQPQSARAEVPPHPPLLEYYEEQQSRQNFLNSLFNRTALHYRKIDRATGLGSGLWYRRKALVEAGLTNGMRVLDVACGPGLVTECAAQVVGPTGYVVGLDPSTGMLHEARKAGCSKLTRAVGEWLPFPDRSFDFLSMGYALRHVTDLQLAFQEYTRVLKPRGVVLILEISRPKSTALACLFRFYIKTVLGTVFTKATGNQDLRTLMRYWWDTTDRCVPPEVILDAMKKAGLARCCVKEWLNGLLRDYRAVKE